MTTKATTVAIWGASGHALVVADIIRQTPGLTLVGFLDEVHPERRGSAFAGLTVLGGAASLPRLRDQGVTHIALGFGHNLGRLRVGDLVRAEGFALLTAVHPRAILAPDVVVGEGTVVAAGAVINPAARVGRCAIINTLAGVDHECVIGDGAHVCPGVRLAGAVQVGRAAWVGIGSTVKEKVSIGAGALIGAGSVVLSDIADGATAYGVPARVIQRS
jgi:acetyltransferase EpsM